MTESAQLLAKVRMPEKGVFLVRCPGREFAAGQTVVVNLGYGPDCGILLCTETYDPAVHGPSVPGYELVRAGNAEDEKAAASNAALADGMSADFMRLAGAQAEGARLLHSRLSLGRQRLFVWYVCPAGRCDLSSVAREVGRKHGVQVMARQLGPRDEVCLLGALGPCGRPCCCATWQTRYPSAAPPDRGRGRDGASVQPNGICGRYKCCLAFEEET